MNYILIVDDRFVTRSGTSILLENELENVLVFEVHSFREALIACCTIVFDLVILDIDLPFGRKCRIIDIFRNLQKDSKIAMLSPQKENIYALRYIKAGANAYLSKSGNTIAKEVEIVLKSEKNVSIDKLISFPHNGEHINNPLEKLAQREFEIAVLFVRGFKNHEIATQLDLQITTVRTRKFYIFRKLEIASIAALSELFEPISEPLLQIIDN